MADQPTLFEKLAGEKIGGITARGKQVIVCGGTGLYLRVLLGGIFEGPEADPDYRATLEQRIVQEGIESLHQELAKIDPEAAAAIPTGNRHRLIRALEVYHLTQKPISVHWREHRFSEQGQFEVETTFLNPPREELYRRIDVRVDAMVAKGWLEEVRGLVAQWGREASGLQIIGYKEITAHLAGEMDWKTTLSLIKQHTRNYAKRQVTWFRRPFS
jgi:tRNA dimethylallyltransferase